MSLCIRHLLGSASLDRFFKFFSLRHPDWRPNVLCLAAVEGSWLSLIIKKFVVIDSAFVAPPSKVHWVGSDDQKLQMFFSFDLFRWFHHDAIPFQHLPNPTCHPKERSLRRWIST